MHFTTLLTTALLAIGLATANTMTIDLHAELVCTDAPFQTFTIGNLNTCHNAEQSFHLYKQHNIGQGLFNRNLRIRVFRDRDCGGGYAEGTLSNQANRQCVGAFGNSFMLVAV